ncbi:NAD-dependent epimerase/dehydratase family protein [Candidatus Nitrosotenuis chungbukensis]|uniref:NAD-dependent epimerase/dehydratase family protein n=1 Tax=Candidatus Nitrosotenuis chungbukensis TaxID=1353246 RepID=UPI0005B26506|nr:NAD-dependent epimerase/dehydratase family protein [Candidatus Nitrosotenuis chungbukensis]WKT58343.1 NAD-dependent epimerase/dehydratase family protein [Candidatus Nitrosotenuis chungbukensis]
MNVVVTGGAGFIGSYLVKQLVKFNHSVVVVDSLYRGKMDNLSPVLDKIKFRQLDIRNIDELRDILKKSDGVFHEAALTDVQESFTKQKEYHDVNVIGTENIFKLASEFGFKVVYASSSSVYGDPDMIPINENSERKPINPYGQTKLDDEFLAEKYSKMGVSIIGLRYFNVYGKGQTGSYAGVITKFINNLRERKPPVIFGDGTQIRDFVYAEDVALANIAAMQSDVKNGFFNVGTGITTSVKKLAQTLIDISGLSLEPEYQKPLEGDVRVSQADITLTKKMLNWEYKMNLEEGLRKFFPL